MQCTCSASGICIWICTYICICICIWTSDDLICICRSFCATWLPPPPLISSLVITVPSLSHFLSVFPACIYLYLPVFACICSRDLLSFNIFLWKIVSLMAWELEFNLFLFGPRKKFPQLGFGVRPIISTRPYNHQDQKLFLIFLHISLFFHSSCTSSILIDHTQSPWKIPPPAPSFCLSFSFLFFTQNTCQAWLSNTCQLCPWFS